MIINHRDLLLSLNEDGNRIRSRTPANKIGLLVPGDVPGSDVPSAVKERERYGLEFAVALGQAFDLDRGRAGRAL